jgi:hypothetical protein
MSRETTRSVEIAANPIQEHDRGLARVFEDAVLRALPDEGEERLVVRFGVWNGEEDGLRFLCKLEARAGATLGAAPAWRWWSPLVRTPQELAGFVREAVRRHLEPSDGARGEHSQPTEFWGWATAGQGGA